MHRLLPVAVARAAGLATSQPRHAVPDGDGQPDDRDAHREEPPSPHVPHGQDREGHQDDADQEEAEEAHGEAVGGAPLAELADELRLLVVAVPSQRTDDRCCDWPAPPPRRPTAVTGRTPSAMRVGLPEPRHTDAVPPRSAARRPGAPDLALVGAALCFGGTFLVVQDAVEDMEPMAFLAVRFTIGALVLWPFARRRAARPGEWRDGIRCGLALWAGYVFQTIGLQYTDSATSAFITYQLVVFVPLLEALVHRRRPHPATLAGVAVAVVGLVLLTDPGGTGGFGRGEVLTLACAVAFGVHVLVVAGACSATIPCASPRSRWQWSAC